jgi:hypothetical protein
MGQPSPLPSPGALPLPPRTASFSQPGSLLSPTSHHPLSPSLDIDTASSTTTASSVEELSYFSLPTTAHTLTPASTLEPAAADANKFAEVSSSLEASTSTDATTKEQESDPAGRTPRPEPPMPLPTMTLRPKKPRSAAAAAAVQQKPSTEPFTLSLPKAPHQLSLDDLEAKLNVLALSVTQASSARGDHESSAAAAPSPSTTTGQQQQPFPPHHNAEDTISVQLVAHIVRALSIRLSDAQARANERERELSAALELLREQQGPEGEGRIERVLVRARASAQTEREEGAGGGRWILRCVDDDVSSSKSSWRSGEERSASASYHIFRDDNEKVISHFMRFEDLLRVADRLVFS